MAEEEIPDPPNPTRILSFTSSLQQSLEYTLADFSPSQICNGPVAVFGPFLWSRIYHLQLLPKLQP